MNADPDTHRCAPADMEYLWQLVENEDLIRVIVERYMLDPVVHRSSSCGACARTWYVVDYTKNAAVAEGVDVVDDVPTARAMLCLPRPTEPRRNTAPKWKGKKKAA